MFWCGIPIAGQLMSSFGACLLFFCFLFFCALSFYVFLCYLCVLDFVYSLLSFCAKGRDEGMRATQSAHQHTIQTPNHLGAWVLLVFVVCLMVVGRAQKRSMGSPVEAGHMP